MKQITEKHLKSEAAKNGYRPEILEKVLLLLGILEQITSVPYLRKRLALKGGTALNLFSFKNLPRLSVDIDFNYIGSHERDVMIAERKTVEEGIIAICNQNNMQSC